MNKTVVLSTSGSKKDSYDPAKKAFISFVPKDLVERISKSKPISIYVPTGRVKRQGVKRKVR